MEIIIENRIEEATDLFEFDDGGGGGTPTDRLCNSHEEILPNGAVYSNSTNYTGFGVTIGMIESNFPDSYCSEIENVDITHKDFSKSYLGLHPTLVASIMVGDKGIASDADLLTGRVTGSHFSDFDPVLTWMLSRDVDVINISYGGGNAVYDSTVVFFDYFVYKYKIPIVAAAGNNTYGGNYVASPSLGYNIISIGNMQNGYTLSSQTSWIEGTLYDLEKPNLVAIGSYPYVYNPETGSTNLHAGTSFAAPAVTATIALMMEKDPSLKGDPTRVLALLSSNANREGFLPNTFDFNIYGLDEKIGAGVLDINKTIFNIYTSGTGELNLNSGNLSNSTIYTNTVYLNYNQQFTMSLMWQLPVLSSSSSVKQPFTNFDIRLVDESSGSTICETSNSHSNYEILYCDIIHNGHYTMEIDVESYEFYQNGLKVQYSYSHTIGN